MFWYRLNSWCYHHRSVLIRSLLGTLVFFVSMHYEYKYGIDMKRGSSVGAGFYIGHFGGIVISSSAMIGSNCNISQGVTIGVSGEGDRRGVPVIGNNVYMGAGAKLIGGIKVGDNVIIGANAVVTRDVPDGAIVVGIPAKVIGENTYTHIILNPYNE